MLILSNTVCLSFKFVMSLIFSLNSRVFIWVLSYGIFFIKADVFTENILA